jgi:hypothetical protein
MTGPGLVAATAAWSAVLAMDAFLALLVLYFTGFVWKIFSQ